MPPTEVPHDLPPMKDLSVENITENVHLVNSQCTDPRNRFLFHRIVEHLHTFCRETQLSTEEWMTGMEFLVKIGQISDDVRKEMILLSDTLGVSSLVDSINHPPLSGATEGTLIGPFHTHAEDMEHGAVIHSDPDATRLLVVASAKDTEGNTLSDVKVDVWEGDSNGFYDVQNPGTGPDGRGVLRSDNNGEFYFQAIVPVSYPIPQDGPVMQMLKVLNRHPNRPGHVHFMLDKEGYEILTTAIYPRGDPYESSDPVFGVKESLVVDLSTADEATAKKYGIKVGTKLLQYDFVLLTDKQARDLRRKNAMEAFAKQGRKVVFHNDLPVPAVET